MSFVAANHTNPGFNDALAEVDGLLTELAGRSERSLLDTCAALKDNGIEQARAVMRADKEINKLEEEVLLAVANAIARHSPVAHDLHVLMGSVKLAQEFERLADHSKSISKRLSWLIKYDSEVAFKDNILKLAELTCEMLRQLLESVHTGDVPESIHAWKLDEKVNEVYLQTMEEAFGGAYEGEPRALINSVFIAKNFERIGDKIKNLVEITHYQRTGEITDIESLDVEDADDTE